MRPEEIARLERLHERFSKAIGNFYYGKIRDGEVTISYVLPSVSDSQYGAEPYWIIELWSEALCPGHEGFKGETASVVIGMAEAAVSKWIERKA